MDSSKKDILPESIPHMVWSLFDYICVPGLSLKLENIFLDKFHYGAKFTQDTIYLHVYIRRERHLYNVICQQKRVTPQGMELHSYGTEKNVSTYGTEKMLALIAQKKCLHLWHRKSNLN